MDLIVPTADAVRRRPGMFIGDVDSGDGVLDRFIDLPPWSHDIGQGPALDPWVRAPVHLKVGADGFVTTCAGIVVTKAG